MSPPDLNCTTLKAGPKLHLESIKIEHSAAAFALVERHRPYMRQWLPWVDAQVSVKDTEGFFRFNREASRRGTSLLMAIMSNNELVGVVGCNTMSWAHRNVSLGYWLGREYQGQGLMTRSVAALCDFLFNEHHFHRIEVRAATGNLGSAAVPSRLGFRHEGTLRDFEWVNDRFVSHDIYGMLKPDWKNGTVSRQ